MQKSFLDLGPVLSKTRGTKMFLQLMVRLQMMAILRVIRGT